MTRTVNNLQPGRDGRSLYFDAHSVIIECNRSLIYRDIIYRGYKIAPRQVRDLSPPAVPALKGEGVMKHSVMIRRSLVPAIILFASTTLMIQVCAREVTAAERRKTPAAGEKKQDDTRKVTDRGRETGSKDRTSRTGDTDRTRERDPRTDSGKKERPAEPGKRKDPSSGTTIHRRPPREADKTPAKKKKEMGESGRIDRHPIQPVIDRRPPCVRPPRPRPPYIHHPPTIIYDYRRIYVPVPVPSLVDEDIYGIDLPFGPILPWEIGEFFLIRLKNLEEEGLGGTMIVTIVQTMDEMGWEEFLDRFGGYLTDVLYYGPVGRTSFLVSMTVSDILDLIVSDDIRWVGEFYPEYKIVPGGRNTKFYVLSLEGDTIGFRRELRNVGVFVMDFDPGTQEYFVRSSQDVYDSVASLWWVARVSGVAGEPFFQPESEWVEVGLAP